MGTGFRVNQQGVAGSVGSMDLDIGFDDAKVMARHIAGLRGILLLVILVVRHG